MLTNVSRLPVFTENARICPMDFDVTVDRDGQGLHATVLYVNIFLQTFQHVKMYLRVNLPIVLFLAVLDECASNPCVHGNCTDEFNGFVCNCQEGFSGETCNGEEICRNYAGN